MHTPLLVHLIFHPSSDEGRALALALHDALNDDPAVPGLRVPTVLAAEDGSHLPPMEHRLDDAVRNIVVVLADDHMLLDPPSLPAGRTTWPDFIGGLWEGCDAPGCRFIPFQLSEYAFPVDSRLEGTAFLRTYAQANNVRSAWTSRALVVEICRFLEGEIRGDKAPVRLFLSHTKQDVNAAPHVFSELVEHLRSTQPVKAWIDSAEIPGGSRFTEEIESGVKNSALLILATRHYSARPWCRKELLLAKRHQRPFAIVDALEGLESRSFPYGGNAPRLRWEAGSAERAVDLVLKETLRHLHARLELEQMRRADDVVLTAPPELATLLRVPKGSAVLYPDPPLGDEEMEELEPLDLTIETPLQRAAQGRTLSGVGVVLSISDSPDTARMGMTKRHLDQALCEISRQLLVRGAVLEYGGHLGSESYTRVLFDMAREYSSLSGVPPAERIINDVGWPLPLEKLPPGDRTRYHGLANFKRVPRPDGVAQFEPATFVEEPTFFDADSPERRYAWARGMTTMREFQCLNARARILLGGATGANADGSPLAKWYKGRIPGVIEEAYLSLNRKQALYVIGAFGGAAAIVASLLQGRRPSTFAWDFQKQAPHCEAMRDLYEKHGPAWEDYDDLATFFATTGIAGLAAQNRLSVDENLELFVCRDTKRIVELLLEGLTRCNSSSTHLQ